jgi:voltage-gated sodium channel
MIGIVVDVLADEHKKMEAEKMGLTLEEHESFEKRIQDEVQSLHVKIDQLVAMQSEKK